MLIKVCGMREPENIRAVAGLGVDMIGFVFYKKSPRYVSSISSCSGLIPNYPRFESDLINNKERPFRVGVFVDEMPQNIITMVYNYKLDYVQLHGKDDALMIENLRRTIDADIKPGLKFIKALDISDGCDFERWREYKGVADLLLFHTKSSIAGGSGKKFNWQLLNEYNGDIPFILSGGIGPDDSESVLSLNNSKMVGIDLNSCFESSPAVKDICMLKNFISKIRDNKINNG